MSPRVTEAYKLEKKKELLKAAKQVFIQKGYTHATMQDILDEAGVSRGALYAYFDNIEHVFIEVLRYDDQEDILLFEPADEQTQLWPHIVNWVQQQRINIEKATQTLVLAKAEFFLSSQYVKNKNSFPYITERYQKLVETIQAVIQKGVERGEFQPYIEAKAIACYLISVIDGLMLNTFQLGAERTNVSGQLSALLLSLKELLCVSTKP